MFAILLICLAILIIKSYFAGRMCFFRQDLTNKVAIITGGNTGIGKETALELAKQNCTIIIASRDKNKSQAAVKHIKGLTNNQNVQSYQLDLGSKESIKQFAQLISKKYDSIDYLINNAGMMSQKRTLNKDNIQNHFAINYLGHFYLTYLLYQKILRSPQPRIVNVSALAHKIIKQINWDNINFQKQFGSIKAYAQSKLFNITFTKCLAKKIIRNHLNARVVALHPGVVRSQFALSFIKSGIFKIFYLILTPFTYIFTKSNKQGAQTTLYSVLCPSTKIINGGYYSDCEVSSVNKLCQDEQVQQKLWRLSQQLLKIRFYA